VLDCFVWGRGRGALTVGPWGCRSETRGVLRECENITELHEKYWQKHAEQAK